MAPDSDVVQRRHAIEAFFKAALEAARRLGMRRTIHVWQVERSGNLGFVLSTIVLELPAADSANRTAPPQPPPTRPERDRELARQVAGSRRSMARP
jgi:hypothetical protein